MYEPADRKMKTTLMISLTAALLVSACGYSRNIPKSWRPVTVEERALKWAVKLCHSFGYEDETIEKRNCIERRYSQYLTEHN